MAKYLATPSQQSYNQDAIGQQRTEASKPILRGKATSVSSILMRN